MRQYLVGSWSNADSYDYSGEMLMGHRQGKSICVDHMLPNGKANLSRYADVPDKAPKKLKEKRSISDQVDLAGSHYQRLEKLSDALDEDWLNGEIKDAERYAFLRKKMDERLSKAWRRIEKEQEKFFIEETNEGITINQEIQLNLSLPTFEFPDTFLGKTMQSLRDGNRFKKAYIATMKLTKFVNNMRIK